MKRNIILSLLIAVTSSLIVINFRLTYDQTFASRAFSHFLPFVDSVWLDIVLNICAVSVILLGILYQAARDPKRYVAFCLFVALCLLMIWGDTLIIYLAEQYAFDKYGNAPESSHPQRRFPVLNVLLLSVNYLLLFEFIKNNKPT